MTRLERSVSRMCRQGRSDYVVTLVPGKGALPPSVQVREAGRRTSFSVPVGNLYLRMVEAAVEATVAARRRRRPRQTWMRGL